MVALRKDVKVGLIVGGITLAVVAVYVGLSALSGSSPAKDAAGVADITKSTDPTTATPAVAKADPKPTPAAPREPATANPTVAVVAPQPRSSAGDDVWSNAFTNGSVQPSVTVTPSLSNPSREPAAKPSEVIQALTNPKTPAAGSQDPTTPTQSASATDPSGSIATNTPTATLTRGAATQPTAGGTTHVVKPGETLSSIAADAYGDANLWKTIVAANPSVEANKLKPGITLNLPAHEKATKAAPAAGDAAAKVDPTRQYVVKPGDSLESIATALYSDRSKWESIYATNKAAIGDSPAKLKVGTVLSLPSAPTKK